MEEAIPEGSKFSDLAFNEMNELWERAKLAEK
jgi:uncharacterized protein YabN with tetrapyrrole methylase and pyrophosphatase domain